MDFHLGASYFLDKEKGYVTFFLQLTKKMYFLVFAQESTKESAIGKALYAELPLVKSALPYVPIPAALP